METPIIYRGHTIQRSEWSRGNYEFFEDGGQSTVCGSIEDCKREIDEKEMSGWRVGGIGFRWLDNAMRYAVYHNIEPEFSFEAP
jgi:hypothetical protein